MTEARDATNAGIDTGAVDLPSDGEAGLGHSLRRMREARGIGIDDVVQTLKFNPRQIEALEADDLDALPGATFVRGMIRGYARLLKIDPEPLLAELASRMPAGVPDVRPPDNMGNAMPNAGVRQIPVLVSLSVLLLVFAATLVAWHFLGDRRGGGEPPRPTSARSDPGETSAAPAVSSAPAATEAPAATIPVPAVAATEATGRQLAFDFLGASWVEVRDATGQIIFTGQYGPGIRQVVAGQPPFQLVIGSAAGVELRYDDVAVDLKPHTRAEVARLTLE